MQPYLSQPGLSYQQMFSTPSAQPYAPTAGQTALPLMQHPDVQALKRQLDVALRKNREYEDAMLHQATLSRQFIHSLRTQHGIICPDCKQEVSHTCTPSSLIRSHRPLYTSANPTGLQTHFTGPPQGNLFAKRDAAPPPSSSDILPGLTAYSTNPNLYPPTSFPCLNVSSLTRATPSYPLLFQPGPSIALDSNDNSEPERKRAQHNLPEEGRIAHQWSEPKPATTPATSGAIMSSVVSTTSEDDDVTSEAESGDVWSIRYNSEVERALDASLVRCLDVGQSLCIEALKFSKDGKYLAMGLEPKGTNIYDVHTGNKICTLGDIAIKRRLIFGLCFSPDSLYLATRSEGLIDIWEISKEHVRNFIRFSSEQQIQDIDFSPDGRLIALTIIRYERGGNCVSTLEIRNWRDGSRKISKELDTSCDEIRFSPNGQYVTAGLASGDLLIWNVRSGQTKRLTGHRQWITHIAFKPDGTGLLSASVDGTVKCWDLNLFRMDGSARPPQPRDSKMGGRSGKSTGHNATSFVAFSSNGRWMVSCSNGGASIWNTYDDELHCELKLQLGSKEFFPIADFDPVSGCLAFAPFDGCQAWILRFKEV